MINNILQNFIQEIQSNAGLQKETYYASIQGDSERYIRWKFLNYIYDSYKNLNCETFSLALESFDRNDMIFKCGNVVHFVEWKAMTLPVHNQDAVEQHKKRMDNLRQLCKSSVKFNSNFGSSKPNLTAYYWSLFLYIDYDDALINHGTAQPNVKFDRQGNFQKYQNIAIGNPGRRLMPRPFLILPKQPPFQGDVRLCFELCDFTPFIGQHSNTFSLTPKKSKLLLEGKPWDTYPKGKQTNLFDVKFGNTYTLYPLTYLP